MARQDPTGIKRLPSLVLTCHDVYDARPTVPPDFNISISIEAFTRAVLGVRDMGYRFVDFATFMAGARHGGLALMTFDDAFASALSGALPVLSAHGIPSVVFVITGSLDKPGDPFPTWLHVLWHNRAAAAQVLAHPLMAQALGEMECAAGDFFDQPVSAIERRFADRVSPDLLERLAGLVAAAPGLGRVTATADQLGGLDAVDLGAHSVSHRSFATIPTADAAQEICASLRGVGRLIDKPTTAIPFCYPYGAVTVGARRIVGREAAAGFTCGERFVSRNDLRSALPRFNLDETVLDRIARARRSDWVARIKDRAHLRLRTGAMWRVIEPCRNLVRKVVR